MFSARLRTCAVTPSSRIKRLFNFDQNKEHFNDLNVFKIVSMLAAKISTMGLTSGLKFNLI